MPDFSFLLVESQTGLDKLHASGLVGLCPKKMDAEADLFVEKMKTGGAIKDAVFSMSIGDLEESSYITFGGYDLK